MSKPSFWADKKVLVTGANGFFGRNLMPLLRQTGAQIVAPSRQDCDLLEQAAVRAMFADVCPNFVIHLAALSGGILSNKKYPADYCYQNLLMNTLVQEEAFRAGVKKYVTLIGGCSYPAKAPSPIAETELWNGYPQPESAPYSVAKKINVTLAEAYRRQHGFDAIVLVPGNVYGPWDNFDLEHSHVIPATIRKYYEAALRGDAEIVAWGSGKPVRDFIYIGDACEAVVRAAEIYSGPDIINISSGVPTTIAELVNTVAELVGFRGQIRWDTTKPDGQTHKVFQVDRMKEWLGYQPPTTLRDGLQKTIAWFKENYAKARLEVAVA
ncbi:MAG: GDP-L-fucose synthase [Verrucomicrobiota bacterium]